MDLLGGYDSNSSSDDDNDNDNDDKDNSTDHHHHHHHVSPPPPPPKKPNKKGKKLLKLQAVLPEHIWNQLSNAHDAMDSDDEEQDKQNKSVQMQRRNEKAASSTGTSSNPTTSSSAKDPDLWNLLQSLPKSKSNSNSNSNSILSKEKTTILGGQENDDDDDDQQESESKSTSHQHQPLGAAFLTSTVTTVRKKKKSHIQVRDIHANNATAAVPLVETVAVDAPPRTPLVETVAVDTPPRLPPPPRSVPVQSIAPRVRTAAPAVNRSYTAAAAPYPSSNVSPYANTAASYSNYPTTANQQQQPSASKKHSRKRQMEQMLRSGQTANIDFDAQLQGQAPNDYVPQSNDNASYQSHGLRVVPTQRYDTSSGLQASTQITGKQKSKHQLNSLLANAASLDSQRMRNPNSQNTNSHRATAKRKYGW